MVDAPLVRYRATQNVSYAMLMEYPQTTPLLMTFRATLCTLIRALRPHASMRLPQLDVTIEIGFEKGSFVAPEPWQRAVGCSPGRPEVVCRVGFGISPLYDRIYMDGLEVDEAYRRKGYASALLTAVVDRVSPPGVRLPVTALHEVSASGAFWSALRAGAVPGLVVTKDVRVSEMDQEARRWRAQADVVVSPRMR